MVIIGVTPDCSRTSVMGRTVTRRPARPRTTLRAIHIAPWWRSVTPWHLLGADGLENFGAPRPILERMVRVSANVGRAYELQFSALLNDLVYRPVNPSGDGKYTLMRRAARL